MSARTVGSTESGGALLLVVAAGAALWWFTRQGVATGVGEAVGSAVVDAGAGAVVGVGDAVGIPRTDVSACQRAIDAGNTWDASFACPALDFLKYLGS